MTKLNIGFWEHLEQIPIVTVTFFLATFVLATFVHIRSISAVTRFGQNFIGSFMGQSLTDANCYGDICPGNICTSNISSISQLLPNFLEPIFRGLDYSRPHFVDQTYLDPYISWTKKFPLFPKFFGLKNFGN